MLGGMCRIGRFGTHKKEEETITCAELFFFF